jgi:hypothetical protein
VAPLNISNRAHVSRPCQTVWLPSLANCGRGLSALVPGIRTLQGFIHLLACRRRLPDAEAIHGARWSGAAWIVMFDFTLGNE